MSHPIARIEQLMRFRPVAAVTEQAIPRRLSADLIKPAPARGPALPHERDEKVGMTDGIPSKRVQQGARDVKRGVLDTSRAPEADVAYRKLKR